MTAPHPEFQKFLDLQRADYRRTLPEKVAQVQALWKAAEAGGAGAPPLAPASYPTPARHAEAGGAGAPPLADLERLVHSLAGTAGTLGFREVGQAARSLERLLTGAAEANRPAGLFTDVQRSDIALAIAALQASLPVV